MKILRYESLNEWEEAIVADKIVRFSKKDDSNFGNVTVIHLIDGNSIETKDSIKTLSARMESENESELTHEEYKDAYNKGYIKDEE